MGPKKDGKNVVQEPPKEVEPEPLPYEIVGYGRFEYLNGVIYEGNWKIVKGAKVKQGYGRLILPLQLQKEVGEEYYQGNWEQDAMNGFGAYYYPDGSIYSGQWLNNKHHGRGKFTLANGTIYEGQWQHHQMNGSGSFVDHLGRKWVGEFREGVFESRRQMQLSKEKALSERLDQTKKQVKSTIQSILKVLEKDQNIDDRLKLYFTEEEYVKHLLKGGVVSYKSKEKGTWQQLLKQCVSGQIKILMSRSQCKTIDGQRILVRQQQGEGQVAEVFYTRASKKGSLLLLQVKKGRWIIVAVNEDI